MAEGYEIRRVEGGRAVDLMPEAAGSYLWSCVLQATEPGSERTLGAALIARTQAGTKVLPRAVNGDSAQQIERLLLVAALEIAERRAASALFAWEPQREGSFEAQRWLDRGFQPHNPRLIVEADTAPAAENSKRQIARIRERGQIPASARVVPLRDAPMAQVGRLKVQAFGGKAQDTIRRAQSDGPGALDPDLSWAVMAGETVAGIALGSRSGADTMFGEAIAVDPAFRGRWVLPLLKGTWICAALDCGLLRLRGEIAVTNAVSRKVFSRDGFDEVATLCDFVRLIKPQTLAGPETAKPTVVVTGAPPSNVSPLLLRLREIGFQGAPGTDDGLLTSLPGRADWWDRTSGSLVRMPYALLSGLPASGVFRVVILMPPDEGPSGSHRKMLMRAAAQLRLRPGFRILELDDSVFERGGISEAEDLGNFLAL